MGDESDDYEQPAGLAVADFQSADFVGPVVDDQSFILSRKQEADSFCTLGGEVALHRPKAEQRLSRGLLRGGGVTFLRVTLAAILTVRVAGNSSANQSPASSGLAGRGRVGLAFLAGASAGKGLPRRGWGLGGGADWGGAGRLGFRGHAAFQEGAEVADPEETGDDHDEAAGDADVLEAKVGLFHLGGLEEPVGGAEEESELAQAQEEADGGRG